MRLSLVTFLVPSYEAGLSFFVDGIGWLCLDDDDLGGGKRWVTVSPDGQGTAFLLTRPSTQRQAAALGNQSGGRVRFFLETRDFTKDRQIIETAGGIFIEDPRPEPYGLVAQWRDPFGNLWDLIQPAN